MPWSLTIEVAIAQQDHRFEAKPFSVLSALHLNRHYSAMLLVINNCSTGLTLLNSELARQSGVAGSVHTVTPFFSLVASMIYISCVFTIEMNNNDQ
jgi:hypothetical protein